jgi:hypothetical protein
MRAPWIAVSLQHGTPSSKLFIGALFKSAQERSPVPIPISKFQSRGRVSICQFRYCNIGRFHGGNNEECRLIGSTAYGSCKNPGYGGISSLRTRRTLSFSP